MTRGILALLLFVSTLSGQPARAADQPLVVYELTRIASGGPSTVPVYLLADSHGEPGIMSFLQLAPRKGGGWTRARFQLVMYNVSESRFGTYGGPGVTPPVPCSAPAPAEVCGQAGNGTRVFWMPTFKPAAGNRYLFAAPQGKVRLYAPWPWRVRETSIGARVVSADADTTTAVGLVSGSGRVEAFAAATAPGGRYGSGAFAMVPCSVKGGYSAGSGTLKSDGSDPGVPISCEPGYYAAFSGTADGRTWTVSGPVVGEYVFPFRLFVFDYPKR